MRHEELMGLALELARSPRKTSPNPRVGAVVVLDGEVIGRGWHSGPGSPHAEVMALDGIEAASATVYVTLEPCAHEGRTPPCTEALIAAGVAQVVIGTRDPDPRVDGRGIDALRAAGIEVEVGVREAEAAEQNRAYLHHRRTGRPLVTVKMATSLDGGFAAPDGSSRWITSPETRAYVHRRRAEVDAVMVGSGTVIADDPSLTARGKEAPAQQPLRVVLDGRGRVRATARVLDGSVPTLIATTSRCSHDVMVAWKEAGAEVVSAEAPDGTVDIPAVLDVLGERGVLEVYAEAGPTLTSTLLREEVAGRVECHVGPFFLGAEALRLADLGVASLKDATRWTTSDILRFGDDLVWIGVMV